ncbi:gamma-glutamyl-gamma-aminobutyrate hydrolase family protein [Streptomyces sp. NPDC004752]
MPAAPSRAEIDAAVTAARRAFDTGPWPRLAPRNAGRCWCASPISSKNTAPSRRSHQDMGGPGIEHRHLRHPVSITSNSALACTIGADKAEASCYHHQHVDRLGQGLTVTARAADGTAEAVELAADDAWFLGVQWHPEGTAHEDPAQQRLFEGLVEAADDRG